MIFFEPSSVVGFPSGLWSITERYQTTFGLPRKVAGELEQAVLVYTYAKKKTLSMLPVQCKLLTHRVFEQFEAIKMNSEALKTPVCVAVTMYVLPCSASA